MSEDASRFVELPESVDDFIENQSNQNTLSKTYRDVSLLKRFLSSVNEQREIHSIEPETLDTSEFPKYISEFLVKVRKPDGEQYEPEILRSFISSFDRFFAKERLSNDNCWRNGFQENKEHLQQNRSS